MESNNTLDTNEIIMKFKTTCDKCKAYGLEFRAKRDISPVNVIDGNVNADILIVGLSPKGKIGHIEERSLSDFVDFNPNGHSYFRDFRKVSEKLYLNWEKQNRNIAHTDLVKCFSETFPPENETQKKVSQRIIVDNCVGFLKKQILAIKPKIIICNGSAVCWEMIRMIPPKQLKNLDSLTSYCVEIDNHKFWVVLSGFIGRIDNRNKRRLGMEIEKIIEQESIKIE